MKKKLKNQLLVASLFTLLIIFLATASIGEKLKYNSPFNNKNNLAIDESDPIGTVSEPNPSEIIPMKYPLKKPKICSDYFNCTLIREIENTHKFLLKNKKGLYTPDKRLEDSHGIFPEYVRLNINSQAMGYLVLYENTQKKKYLNEAKDRLTYMYSLDPSLLESGLFSAHIAYTFLYGYQLTGNTSYLAKGLGTTQKHCLSYNIDDPWSLTLNWGYMCSMALGKAYKITNNITYLQMSRNITRRTLQFQFPDGSFPHIPGAGKNIGYSTWMYFELGLNRIDDPNNPDNDIVILKGADFLASKVDENGSMIYEDENGTYDSNPGNLPSRGGITASPAYTLRSVGKDYEARKVLNFLFSQQVPKKGSGSYPDMFPPYSLNSTYNNSTFITNNVSVLRTSLVFWELATIASINNHPCKTPEISCTINANNCNVAFRELNSCGMSAPGTDYCINGVYTGCLDKNLVTIRDNMDCGLEPYSYCDELCTVTCSYIGKRKCINDNCSACITISTICNTLCIPGQSCV